MSDSAQRVFLSPKAWQTLQAYFGCARVTNLLAFNGSVTRLDNDVLYVDQVFLPAQKVDAITSEVTAEARAELCEEILVKHDDKAVDLINRLKLWGVFYPGPVLELEPSKADRDCIRSALRGSDSFILHGMFNLYQDARFDLHTPEGEQESLSWAVCRGRKLAESLQLPDWSGDDNVDLAQIAAEVRAKVQAR
ncbi:MAG: hypothetical protein K2W82_17345 [Candidatus Obscuribacterales bacterium]|nr:hypothetical protein [Candidatus Obscuribacterales bacterium]